MASDSPAEEWRQIAAQPGYQISNLGRVQGPTGNILKTFIRGAGYHSISIRKRNYHVHRMIAEAFLGPAPTPKAHVNHKDGIRSNSVLDNLEWTTASGNQKHRYEVLGHKGTCHGKFGGKHPVSIPIIATDPITGDEYQFAAGMDAVRAGFRSDGVSRACNGLISSHAGFLWRFADGYKGNPKRRSP